MKDPEIAPFSYASNTSKPRAVIPAPQDSILGKLCIKTKSRVHALCERNGENDVCKYLGLALT
jgi:hypothetical protein